VATLSDCKYNETMKDSCIWNRVWNKQVYLGQCTGDCPSQRDVRASRTYYPKEHEKCINSSCFKTIYFHFIMAGLGYRPHVHPIWYIGLRQWEQASGWWIQTSQKSKFVPCYVMLSSCALLYKILRKSIQIFQYWVKVLCPTWHKLMLGHCGDVLPSQSLGYYWRN